MVLCCEYCGQTLHTRTEHTSLSDSTLFYNGRILTLDPAHPTAEAMLVRDGKIVLAASRDDCEHAAAAGMMRMNLEGAWVLPGLTDAHIHFTMFAVGLRNVHLEGTRSLDEALRLVAERAQRAQPNEWILGGRWDHNRWNTPVTPDKFSLDRVAPNNPVVLSSRDGHSIWANSLALRLAGVDSETPDPPGGKIARLDTGREPAGLLLENAEDLVRNAVPDITDLAMAEAVEDAWESALRSGITSIHDFDGMNAIRTYRKFRDANSLKLRVYKSIPVAALEWAIDEGIRTGDGDEWFRFGPTKIFTDGALGSHSAAMLEPFADDPTNYGIEVTPPAELQPLLLKASRAGIACALHAIGDKANRNALDAFQRVRAEVPEGKGLRHRIEHAQHVHPKDLPRFAELDIIASMQPIHATSDMYTADRLLSSRRLHSYAWRSLAESGARLAFGSDAPVEPLEPLLGIHAAITRQREGMPSGGWQPEERISAQSAYEGFTRGAAWASGEESIKGCLAPGMLADFVLLSDNPLECDPAAVPDIRVMATYIGGNRVYSA